MLSSCLGSIPPQGQRTVFGVGRWWSAAQGQEFWACSPYLTAWLLQCSTLATSALFSALLPCTSPHKRSAAAIWPASDCSAWFGQPPTYISMGTWFPLEVIALLLARLGQHLQSCTSLTNKHVPILCSAWCTSIACISVLTATKIISTVWDLSLQLRVKPSTYDLENVVTWNAEDLRLPHPALERIMWPHSDTAMGTLPPMMIMIHMVFAFLQGIYQKAHSCSSQGRLRSLRPERFLRGPEGKWSGSSRLWIIMRSSRYPWL